MTGGEGSGVTLTSIGAEILGHPWVGVTVSEQFPVELTVIDLLVEPFDHRFPVALGEVKVTLFPAQKLVGPFGTIEIGVPVDSTTVVDELLAVQVPDKETE